MLLSEKLNQMLDIIANQEIQSKTFVFQREETQQSHIVQCQLDLHQNFINLNNLLSQHCPLNLHRVSIYDPNANAFASLAKLGADNGFLHKSYLEPSVILIRFKRRHSLPTDSDSVDSSLQPDAAMERKDGRSKERSIGETIELVKRWRDLHLHGHKTLRRRLNLQDAAKMVGVSKKSLDDYYCQLRLGEFYGFDFAHSLQEKMGVLRNFVKDHKDQPSQRDRKRRQNQKHPKNLRVIDRYQLETKTLLPSEDQGESGEGMVEEIVHMPQLGRAVSQEGLLEQRFEEIQGDQMVFHELSNLEHQFFKGFELALDEPSDPYRDIERDFRRKDWEDSNSFLYFDI